MWYYTAGYGMVQSRVVWYVVLVIYSIGYYIVILYTGNVRAVVRCGQMQEDTTIWCNEVQYWRLYDVA